MAFLSFCKIKTEGENLKECLGDFICLILPHPITSYATIEPKGSEEVRSILIGDTGKPSKGLHVS